jgi:FtsZ-binding cell division protein ZapB
MLFKYANVKFRFKDSKDTIVVLQQDIEDLKEKMRAERETAEARYQELSQKRVSEMETAMAVERSLRDQFDKMDQEWRG